MKTSQKVNQKNNASTKSKTIGGSKTNSQKNTGSTNGTENQKEEPKNTLPEKVDQQNSEHQEEQLEKVENQEAVSSSSEKKVTGTALVDMEKPLPDLSKAKPKNIDLSAEYWSPEAPGETRVMIFSRVVTNDLIPDMNNPGEYIEKDCAYFLGVGKAGYQVIKCAAARLVSICYNLEPRGIYQFTYKGKKKNKTNSYDSFDFAVNPVEILA